MSLETKKNILFLLPLVISLFFQSCVTNNDTTNYYDLGRPSPVWLDGINLEIVPFSNYSEVCSEMLYRVDNNRINYDPINRWAKSPNVLLTSFFKSALGISSSGKEYNNDAITLSLSAEVITFDIDLQNKKTILGTKYTIRYRGEIFLAQNKTFEQKYNQEIPSEFASLMALSAHEFLNTVCVQAEEIKAKITKQHE